MTSKPISFRGTIRKDANSHVVTINASLIRANILLPGSTYDFFIPEVTINDNPRPYRPARLKRKSPF
jgi:hypothetical protein